MKDKSQRIMQILKILFLLNIITVSLCYTQWVWQNPKPTGNNLLQVHFINKNRGWIIGENGELFKTTNGGNKWIEIPFDQPAMFTKIQALDPVNIWLLEGRPYPSDTPKIFFSSDCGDTWEKRFPYSSLLDSIRTGFNDVWFRDHIIGLAVGDSGIILKTIDGSANWNFQARPTEYPLKKIKFLDDSIGFTCGGVYTTEPYPPPSTLSYSEGIILRTTNAGTSWQTIYSDSINIRNVYFRNTLLGWALGTSVWKDQFHEWQERHFILNTTDGGITWTAQRVGSQLEDIYFVSDTHGWAVGRFCVLYSTTNSGYNWTGYCVRPCSDEYLYSVYFTDNLHGYIVGVGGAITQTTNGGQNWWNYDTVLINDDIDDVHFINPDTGWYVQSDLYRTTDGGINWTTSGHSELQRVFCIDKNNCWACGYHGKIMFSSDAGASWSAQNSGFSGKLEAIRFFNNQIGWAAGNQVILKTTNGGATWFTQYTGNIGSFVKIVIQNTSNVWVYGSREDVSTINGGLTWGKINPYSGVFFLNPDTGWLHRDGNLCRTFNGGQTLETMRPCTYFMNMQFTDINNGWEQHFDLIKKTLDGGRTWDWQLSVNFIHQFWSQSMDFIDSNHGWAAGDGGTLIRYGYQTALPPETSTIGLKVNEGWNLLSLPVEPAYHIKYSLYPTAISSAFVYDKSYIPNDSLELGTGYWLKFATDDSIQFEGKEIDCISFDMKKGWNIIGGITFPVETQTISTLPSDIVISNYYGYDDGYQASSIVEPGKGYWVKISQDGKLTLVSQESMRKNIEEENILERSNYLTFKDSKCHEQKLFFTSDIIDKKVINHYELPPVPPEGIFDVRFISQNMLEAITTEKPQEFPIQFIGITFPLELVWEIKIDDPSIWTIEIREVEQRLVGHGTKKIQQPPDGQIKLKVFPNVHTNLPRTYSLEQNYPNPFNQSTIIHYELPEKCRIRLVVYDILGREVVKLIDEIKPVGRYDVSFDANGLSSGIYFYKITSERYSSVKKILLIR
ncbi:MAG: T9SS type A sorting domain-containing protein [Bacteroidota bacterium]|nr:T9SS type A sorting domain-containing protein [Bacteroidota bacterium]